ncbi:CBS domain-containing protein [Desulfohalovibrio reitneri]|uniref:CBS domain-containing protein n=1 Tax=Desulfohalovibrio reitneri TaxID=1307759 RepID=UPI0004A74A72|nr:CBS domain-containing protein [Desulfohalovibrio reitneri]
MQTAKDIMSREVITLSPDQDIAEAAKILLENKINGAPVVDAGKVVGVLTQADLVSQQKRLRLPSVFTILDGFFSLGGSVDEMQKEMGKITAMTVGQAMTRNPTVLAPDTPLDEAATLMVDSKLYTLPVVDGESVVGVVGKSDILNTLTASGSSGE